MTSPIYSSQEHRSIVETFMTMCLEFSKDVSSKVKYNNYLDVVQVIVEYSNGYGEGVKENNFYDWLMIIPINLILILLILIAPSDLDICIWLDLLLVSINTY